MEHLDYIAFFEDAAKRHNEIAHGQLLTNGKDRRQSFFLMNDEEEMQLTLMNNAAFPALSLMIYAGKLNAADNAIVREHLYGGFDVRFHVENLNDYIAVEQARGKAKKICGEIIALMIEESERRCSLFKSLDINSIRFQFIGPINTNEYGCQYIFNWKANADTINHTDTGSVFSL